MTQGSPAFEALQSHQGESVSGSEVLAILPGELAREKLFFSCRCLHLVLSHPPFCCLTPSLVRVLVIIILRGLPDLKPLFFFKGNFAYLLVIVLILQFISQSLCLSTLFPSS